VTAAAAEASIMAAANASFVAAAEASFVVMGNCRLKKKKSSRLTFLDKI
jgi:hypothetical protein